jgi:hypothetical protein
MHEQHNVFPTRSNGKQTPKDSMHVTVSKALAATPSSSLSLLGFA